MMAEFTTDLREAAEGIADGWYPQGTRIDWEDFLDRLEAHAGVDLGCDMLSPLIVAIKDHVRRYRSAKMF